MKKYISFAVLALSFAFTIEAADKKPVKTRKQKEAQLAAMIADPRCSDYIYKDLPCPSVLEMNQTKAEAKVILVLRDPDSYKKIGWLPCASDPSCIKYNGPVMKDGTLWVLHYRAKNGFGGYEFGSQAFWLHNTMDLIRED